MKKAGSLLDPVFRKLGIEAGVRLERIRSEWQTLFDRPLSLHMSPARLSEGELLLSVDSPIWIQQLNYYKHEIVEKLTGYGVREVRFRLGRVAAFRNVPQSGQSLPSLSPDDEKFVNELADCVGDPEIGKAVRSAAERSLRAKKRSGR